MNQRLLPVRAQPALRTCSASFSLPSASRGPAPCRRTGLRNASGRAGIPRSGTARSRQPRELRWAPAARGPRGMGNGFKLKGRCGGKSFPQRAGGRWAAPPCSCPWLRMGAGQPVLGERPLGQNRLIFRAPSNPPFRDVTPRAVCAANRRLSSARGCPAPGHDRVLQPTAARTEHRESMFNHGTGLHSAKGQRDAARQQQR